MSRAVSTLTMALALAALLTGCGQKGPLHLPAPAEPVSDVDGDNAVSP